MANQLLRIGGHEAAITACNEALVLRESGEPDAALRLLRDASRYGETALGLARAAAHPYREVICLDNLGMLAALGGGHGRAFALIDEAQAISVGHGYSSVESSTLHQAGST